MASSALVLFAQTLLLTALIHFESLDPFIAYRDMVANIYNRQEELRQGADNLTSYQKLISGFSSVATRLIYLWACRTRPQFLVFKGVHDIISCTKWNNCDQVKDFINFTNSELENQTSQLCSLEVWVGKWGRTDEATDESCMLTEAAFFLFKDQLDRCALFVKESAADTILSSSNRFRVLNFVAVRILSCSGLPKSNCALLPSLCNYFESVDPFVRVRVGKSWDDWCTYEDWLRTDVVENTTDPKWDSAELHVNNTIEICAPLQLEVMDSNSYGADVHIGCADVKFQALQTGTWQDLTLNLKVGGQMNVQVYIAQTARELVGINPFDPFLSKEAARNVDAEPQGDKAEFQIKKIEETYKSDKLDQTDQPQDQPQANQCSWLGSIW